MLNTIQSIRDTFAKPKIQAREPLILREQISDREASLSTLREFRRNRVRTRPIPSQSTSVFE